MIYPECVPTTTDFNNCLAIVYSSICCFDQGVKDTRSWFLIDHYFKKVSPGRSWIAVHRSSGSGAIECMPKTVYVYKNRLSQRITSCANVREQRILESINTHPRPVTVNERDLKETSGPGAGPACRTGRAIMVHG